MKRPTIAIPGFALAFSLVSTVASAQAAGSASTTVSQAGTPADSTAKSESAAKAAAPADLPNFFKDVQTNAFVSFGYNNGFNQPANRQNPLRVFDSNSNSFLIDVAELVLQKGLAKVGDFGFRIDLEAGSAIPVKTQSTGLVLGAGADLQQALVSYIAPVGTGLRLDFGKFVTHMGLEVIEGFDGYNDNYSRSLLFNYAIPFTHTGVKGGYTFNPQLTVMAMAVNGWDLAVDNNKGKSLGFQVALAPVSPVAIYLNYLGGPETPDTGAFMRHMGDVVATYKLSELLTIGVNGDYGLERGTSAVTPGADAKWSGLAGYVKLSPDPRYFVSLRTESMKDDGGTRFGLGKSTRATEFTLTPSYRVNNNFIVRAEGRYDSINQDAVYFDQNGKTKRNQATLGFNAMFVY